MANTTTIKRAAAGALLSAVGAVATLGFATLGPAAGKAQATCDPICHGTWCPGDPINQAPQDLANTWDRNVCHEWHQVHGGGHAEGPLPADAPRCPPFAFMCP